MRARLLPAESTMRLRVAVSGDVADTPSSRRDFLERPFFGLLRSRGLHSEKKCGCATGPCACCGRRCGRVAGVPETSHSPLHDSMRGACGTRLKKIRADWVSTSTIGPGPCLFCLKSETRPPDPSLTVPTTLPIYIPIHLPTPSQDSEPSSKRCYVML